MVGGIIMTHGDDRGLILPPRVAPIQVVSHLDISRFSLAMRLAFVYIVLKAVIFGKVVVRLRVCLDRRL